MAATSDPRSRRHGILAAAAALLMLGTSCGSAPEVTAVPADEAAVSTLTTLVNTLMHRSGPAPSAVQVGSVDRRGAVLAAGALRLGGAPAPGAPADLAVERTWADDFHDLVQRGEVDDRELQALRAAAAAPSDGGADALIRDGSTYLRGVVLASSGPVEEQAVTFAEVLQTHDALMAAEPTPDDASDIPALLARRMTSVGLDCDRLDGELDPMAALVLRSRLQRVDPRCTPTAAVTDRARLGLDAELPADQSLVSIAVVLDRVRAARLLDERRHVAAAEDWLDATLFVPGAYAGNLAAPLSALFAGVETLAEGGRPLALPEPLRQSLRGIYLLDGAVPDLSGAASSSDTFLAQALERWLGAGTSRPRDQDTFRWRGQEDTLRDDLAVRTAMLLDPDFEPSAALVAEDRALAARVGGHAAAVLPLAFVALTTESRNGTPCATTPWVDVLRRELDTLRTGELSANTMIWLTLLRPIIGECIGDTEAREIGPVLTSAYVPGARPGTVDLADAQRDELLRWVGNECRCQHDPTGGPVDGPVLKLGTTTLLTVGRDAVRQEAPGPLTAIHLRLRSTAIEQSGCAGLPSLDLRR